MEILEIKGSSAISKITLNQENNIVGISFTYNPSKEYLFSCDEELNTIKSKLLSVESVGKLVNEFRKDGTLKPIEVN